MLDRRLSIYFPREEKERRVRQLAKDRGISVSALVREAIAEGQKRLQS
ncbi:MAG: ribbon-helix-helix protein, CopG family [Proteobacteria bacterium]|nr:ribbon-helix-helix protein, CopG family [Pseudomonadota bacterium]